MHVVLLAIYVSWSIHPIHHHSIYSISLVKLFIVRPPLVDSNYCRLFNDFLGNFLITFITLLSVAFLIPGFFKRFNLLLRYLTTHQALPELRIIGANTLISGSRFSSHIGNGFNLAIRNLASFDIGARLRKNHLLSFTSEIAIFLETLELSLLAVGGSLVLEISAGLVLHGELDRLV